MSVAAKRKAQPPKPWAYEQQGLSEVAMFSTGSRSLSWCAGQWTIGGKTASGTWVYKPAGGVPAARSLEDARRVGCEFLHDCARLDAMEDE